MRADKRTPQRAAAEWFVSLREEPQDMALRARFDAWRTADPRHAAAWVEMQHTAQAIASAPAERREYRLPASTPRRSRAAARGPVRWRRWQAVGLAAACACAVVLALPAITLRLQADHLSGTGAVETVRLDDGSTVVLGPGSAIAVDYAANRRGIRLLAGQAMFEVQRDRDRPFQVAARNVTTTVLGTGFDVRMIGAGRYQATGVAVRHGRVRVEDGRTARELGAGEWVRIGDTREVTTGAMPPELVGAWQSGTLPVRNRPIAEAIDELRPWFVGRILLTDAALGGKRVTGTYDARNPVASLQLIVAPHGGTVMRITPWLLIVSAR